MTAKSAKDIDKLNFEQAIFEMEGIVSKLESGEAGLEEATELYMRGQQLQEICNAKLSSARLQVEKINVAKGGALSLETFNREEG